MEVEKYVCVCVEIPHHSLLNETVAVEQVSWQVGDYLQRKLMKSINMKSVEELQSDLIVKIILVFFRKATRGTQINSS